MMVTALRKPALKFTKLKIDNKFIERYLNDNSGEEKLLNDFLSKEGLLDTRNEEFLENILQKLSKSKFSFFSGNHEMAERYKKLFSKYLEDAIWNTDEAYYNDIISFFTQIKNRRYSE